MSHASTTRLDGDRLTIEFISREPRWIRPQISEIAQELKKLRPEEGAQRGRDPKNDTAAMTKEIQDSYAVLLSVFKWLHVRQTPLDSVPEERD